MSVVDASAWWFPHLFCSFSRVARRRRRRSNRKIVLHPIHKPTTIKEGNIPLSRFAVYTSMCVCCVRFCWLLLNWQKEKRQPEKSESKSESQKRGRKKERKKRGDVIDIFYIFCCCFFLNILPCCGVCVCVWKDAGALDSVCNNPPWVCRWTLKPLLPLHFCEAANQTRNVSTSPHSCRPISLFFLFPILKLCVWIYFLIIALPLIVNKKEEEKEEEIICLRVSLSLSHTHSLSLSAFFRQRFCISSPQRSFFCSLVLRSLAKSAAVYFLFSSKTITFELCKSIFLHHPLWYPFCNFITVV